MSNKTVIRPQAEKGKISCKNEFELCYLRHQYLRKTTYNPTNKEMKPYYAISSHFAKNTFYTYKNLFRMIGFELDDLINIANIHLISFLGLFSLEVMPEKYKAFESTFTKTNKKNTNKEDILNKNKANYTMFLKQRMEDVVRVCRQKARNIKGLQTEEYLLFCGPNKPPRQLSELEKNYEKLGFRKIDIAVFKSVRKKANTNRDLIFKFNNKWYIAIPIEKKSLSLVDFCGADLDPHDSIHNMDPEQIFFASEEQTKWESLREQFDSKPKARRVGIIRKFINKNKLDPSFKEEVRAARKLLKEMDI